MNVSRLLLLGVIALTPSPVLAHTEAGEIMSFSSGLTHPVHGLDHVLAMLAVGMWAGLLGRRSALGLPLTFLGAMLTGLALALIGIEVPAVETGIVASVLVLGLAIASGLRLPAATAAMICAIFGLVHGYAHGNEMGDSVDAVHYIGGFLVATALLHAGGFVAAAFLVRKTPDLNRMLGGGIALTGVALLFA